MAFSFTCLDSCVSRCALDQPITAKTTTGLGVRLHKTLGRADVESFDPFVSLIEFSATSPFCGGGPEHPLSGIETVTLLLQGQLRHEDCFGHHSCLSPGDAQYLRAGVGVVQCEAPGGDGITQGVTLWLNLRNSDKGLAPAFATAPHRSIPKVERHGLRISVVSGEAFGRTGPVKPRTPLLLLSVRLALASIAEVPLPSNWNAFVYVVQGRVIIGPPDCQSSAQSKQLIKLSTEESMVRLENGLDETMESEEETHVILGAAQCLKEPMFRKGPFVQSSQKALDDVIEDFRHSRNAFSKAQNWRSPLSSS